MGPDLGAGTADLADVTVVKWERLGPVSGLGSLLGTGSFLAMLWAQLALGLPPEPPTGDESTGFGGGGGKGGGWLHLWGGK